jgi:hypothetical protein
LAGPDDHHDEGDDFHAKTVAAAQFPERIDCDAVVASPESVIGSFRPLSRPGPGL